MQEFTVTQAMYMAGVDQDDDPWVRDSKFAAWLKSVKGRVVEDLTQPVPDGTLVIVIKKEKP